MIRLRVLALVLASAAVAGAAGHEFDSVVKAIETRFDATRTRIPLMGLANFAVKIGHPAGTSGVRIALFEDLHMNLDADRQAELDGFMDRLASARLRPFIRTRSEGEATYIFCGETGKNTQLLMATFNRREATVIEVKVNLETLARWIQSPELAGKSLTSPQ